MAKALVLVTFWNSLWEAGDCVREYFMLDSLDARRLKAEA